MASICDSREAVPDRTQQAGDKFRVPLQWLVAISRDVRVTL